MSGLDDESSEVMELLTRGMFIYDPMDGGDETWTKRQVFPPARTSKNVFCEKDSQVSFAM